MTETILPPPAFRHAFRAGEIVPDSEFARFDRYLARQPDETGPAYVARLERVGLAVAFSAEDSRDYVAFKRAIAEATERRVPIAMVTGSTEDSEPIDPTEIEAAKQAALAAARTAR